MPAPTAAIGAQILVRRPRPMPWAFAYAPRGPVATAWTPAAIDAFTECLPDGPPAPWPVASATCGSTRRSRRTARSTRAGALRRALRAAGWRPAPPIQPASTRVIDLRADEAALWGDLRKKWRQYVNKARSGGVVVVDADGDRLGEFYRIYRETADRAGFLIRTEAAYRDVWEAYRPAGQARLLFAQTADGEPVATLFLVRCGPRVVEPYGGMTAAGADSRANYLLKWEAIRTSREAGATSYDLWGLATGGIAHFKTGFGGREVRYIGAWDLVLDPLGRQAYEAAVKGRVRWARWRHGRSGATGAGRELRGRRVSAPREATPDELDDWDARAVDAAGGHVYQSRAWAEHRARLGLAAALPRPRGRRPGPEPRTSLAAHRGRERVHPTRSRAGRRGRGRARRSPGRRERGPGGDGDRRRRRRPGGARGRRGLRDGHPRRGLRADRGDPAVAPPDRAAARTTASTRCSRSGTSRSRPASASGRRRRRGWRSCGTTRRTARTGWGRGSPRPPSPPTPPSTGSTTCCSPPGSGASSRSGRGPGSSAGGGRPSRPGTSSTSRSARPGRDRRAARRPRPVPPRRPPLHGALRATTPRPGEPTRARSTWPAGAPSSSRSARARARWTSAASTCRARAGEPVEGEPMWGLYQHKLSFGGRWLELAGAHERVIRPRRYAAGPIHGPRRATGPPMTDDADDRRPDHRREARARRSRASPPPSARSSSA